MSTEAQGSPSGGAVSVAAPRAAVPSHVSSIGSCVARRRGAMSSRQIGLLGLYPGSCSRLYVRGVRLRPLRAAPLVGMYWPSAGSASRSATTLFSHGAFRARPTMRWLMAVCGAMERDQGTAAYSAAVHRRHHGASDEPGDPRTRPRLAAAKASTRSAARPVARPLRLDAAPTACRERCTTARTSCATRICARSSGITSSSCSRGWRYPRSSARSSPVRGTERSRVSCGAASSNSCVSSNSTWALNSICHRFGRRTYPTKDQSGDVAWLALTSMGESWHNSHHALPSAARHGRLWWQLDLNYAAIRALELCGLASNVQRPRG